MRWYVMRSKPNQETPLWRELYARGFECYYPQLHVRPANPRSRKSRPYFPGYVFVKADLARAGLSTFQWMPFSGGLVSFGGCPAEVPEELVAAVRRQVERANASGRVSFDGLQSGQRVRIADGPFRGYQAIFDAYLSGTERASVFLSFLESRGKRLVLPAGQLAPA